MTFFVKIPKQYRVYIIQNTKNQKYGKKYKANFVSAKKKLKVN